MIMMDSGTPINLFENKNMITDIQKAEMPMNFLTNEGSRIVDEVGGITGSKNKISIQR